MTNPIDEMTVLDWRLARVRAEAFNERMKELEVVAAGVKRERAASDAYAEGGIDAEEAINEAIAWGRREADKKKKS